MNYSNICILILTCNKEHYLKKRFEQYEFLPKNIQIYYLFGKSNLLYKAIPNADNLHILEAPCGDFYEDIPQKIWFAYSYLRNFYDIIIKIDDNIKIIDVSKLIEIVVSESDHVNYGALKGIGYSACGFNMYHGGKVNNKIFNSFPSFQHNLKYAGCSYFITKKAVDKLQQKDFLFSLYEDYAIGLALLRHNIPLHVSECSRLNLLEDMGELHNSFGHIDFLPAPHSYNDYFLKLYNTIPNDPSVIIDVHGGLANQLFQIATGLAYSIQHSKKLILNASNKNGRPYYWNSVFSNFKDTVIQDSSKEIDYKEESFKYNEIPELKGDCHLWGYFQSSKYFKLIDSDFHKSLNIKPSNTLSHPNIVVVHARRGDYCESEIKINYHNPLPQSYYDKAVALMKTRVKEPVFVLISDDNTFWNSITTFQNEKYVVFDESDELKTLSAMMGAKNFIIANSTFSWWGAKFSGSKNVIAPKDWFGPLGPQDWQDIYEEHMTIV